MTIVWTSRAVGDLIAIADYINQHNPAAALMIRDKIQSATSRLAAFPLSGHPGRVAETRELVVPGTHYIVPYRVKEGRVEILAIFHTARDWPELI